MHYPLPTSPPTLSYEGTGDFSVKDDLFGSGPVVLECAASGAVLCWCVDPPLQLSFYTSMSFATLSDAHFSCHGTLTDGRSFTCPNLSAVSRPGEHMPANAIAFRARQLVVGPDDPAGEWTYALTNLLLGNFSTDATPASGTLIDGNATVVLTPASDYARRMKHLRAYNGKDVTATLRLSALVTGCEVHRIADDLCLVLSVLTGNKVNWVARESATTVVFEHRVTKPCSGWPVLGRLEKVLGKDWTWHDLLDFALKALPIFERHAATYDLRIGLIDSWIDAGITTDFLESRALKTAIVLEVIKSAYRDHYKVTGSFGDLLRGVHQDLGIVIPDATLADIVKIRNMLVHEGGFLTVTTLSKLEQYEIIRHHTDRLLLALTGHPA